MPNCSHRRHFTIMLQKSSFFVIYQKIICWWWLLRWVSWWCWSDDTDSAVHIVLHSFPFVLKNWLLYSRFFNSFYPPCSLCPEPFVLCNPLSPLQGWVERGSVRKGELLVGALLGSLPGRELWRLECQLCAFCLLPDPPQHAASAGCSVSAEQEPLCSCFLEHAFSEWKEWLCCLLCPQGTASCSGQQAATVELPRAGTELR